MYRKINDFKVPYNPERIPTKEEESRFLHAELQIINVVVCSLV